MAGPPYGIICFGRGGGVTGEGEDTDVVVTVLRETMGMAARSEIRVANTLIAQQHLTLRKSGYHGGAP